MTKLYSVFRGLTGDIPAQNFVEQWALWSASITRSLGYARPHLEDPGKGVEFWLQEPELMLVDRAVGILKAKVPSLYRAFTMRFCQRLSYREIAKVRYQDTNEARSDVHEALDMVAYFMARLYAEQVGEAPPDPETFFDALYKLNVPLRPAPAQPQRTSRPPA